MPATRRPAIFISSLSPGYIAGGSQCTLAFLQAVAVLHSGRVHYLGPPFLDDAPRHELSLASVTAVPDRSAIRKIRDLAAGLHVDRTGPLTARIVAGHSADAVVYVNGESAAPAVPIARSRGLATVFIPHNYPAEYAAGHQTGPVQRFREWLVHRWTLQAYREASVVLTLTDHDRRSFEAALRGRRQGECHPDMYFGFRSRTPVSQARAVPEFTILLGTNFGLAENERGVLEFVERIWPAVALRMSARLVLAGRAPSSAIKSAVRGLGERVSLFERPSHAEMEAIFAACSASVAASREGSGIKLRVAESLRHGLPVVCTEHCARGYERVSPQVLRVFAMPEEAIAHLVTLAGEQRHRLEAAARAEYERLFSFEAGLKKLAWACRGVLA